MKIIDLKLRFNIYKMPLTKCVWVTFNQESISCYILQTFSKEMSLFVYSNGYQYFFQMNNLHLRTIETQNL